MIAVGGRLPRHQLQKGREERACSAGMLEASRHLVETLGQGGQEGRKVLKDVGLPWELRMSVVCGLGEGSRR